MRRSALCGALASLVVGCGEAGSPAPTAASATPSAAISGAMSAAPSESAAAAPPGPRASLARKATPKERYERDRAACDGGDGAACRHLAYRFSGIGNEAGCGVSRGRDYPFVKRTIADADADELAYLGAITKACTLGDQQACALARVAPKTYRLGELALRHTAARRDPSEIGIWVFRSRSAPAAPPPGVAARDEAKTLSDRRAGCIADFDACVPPDTALYRQPKAPKDGSLDAAVLELAKTVCEETHDCDDIYVALDKAQHSPAALAPVRAAFAKTLSDACVEGDCTCGDAARYLPAEDPSRVDLAILGCENGEADACAILADLYDSGRGVPADAARAQGLYALTCPPILPIGATGEYARSACDHLAAIFLAGEYPGKDRERGWYYARAACPAPGHELDHAPCIRLATIWATKKTTTLSEGINRERAMGAAFGSRPDFNHECDRPSVASECAQFKKALESAN